MDFKITESGFFDSRIKFPVADNILTPLREVTEFEIECFTEDGGETFLDNKKYEIKRGFVLVSKPGQMRKSRLHFRVNYIHAEVYSDEIKKILDGMPDVFKIDSVEEYTKIIENLSKAGESDFKGNELYITSLFYRLLYMLTRDVNRLGSVTVNFDRDVLVSAVKFMENHYNEPLTLSKMAESVNLSPVYFHKIFKVYTGKTPHDFLQNIRMNHARNLLTSTNKSIAEIALSCGFTSQSYFNAVFKKELNTTPLKYRKVQLDRYGI